MNQLDTFRRINSMTRLKFENFLRSVNSPNRKNFKNGQKARTSNRLDSSFCPNTSNSEQFGPTEETKQSK